MKIKIGAMMKRGINVKNEFFKILKIVLLDNL
jgi:hypothetical protein